MEYQCNVSFKETKLITFINCKDLLLCIVIYETIPEKAHDGKHDGKQKLHHINEEKKKKIAKKKILHKVSCISNVSFITSRSFGKNAYLLSKHYIQMNF